MRSISTVTDLEAPSSSVVHLNQVQDSRGFGVNNHLFTRRAVRLDMMPKQENRVKRITKKWNINPDAMSLCHVI